MAFWTLLAAFIAGVATEDINLTCLAKIWLTPFPIILGGAHLLWIWGIRRADLVDRKEEGHFRHAMRCEIEFKEDDKLTEAVREIVDSSGIRKHWNACSQAMTTIALVFLAILSVWLIHPAERPNQAPKPLSSSAYLHSGHTSPMGSGHQEG